MDAAAPDDERIQTAIVLWSRGDLNRLRDAMAMTGQDWRDTLVRADLAMSDWQDRLDVELGKAD